VARRSRSGRTHKSDPEFLSEAEEIVGRMRGGLADLEDQRAARDEVDPDVVNRLYRSAHSLEALAGVFGFDLIRRLAHQLEGRVCGAKSESSGSMGSPCE